MKKVVKTKYDCKANNVKLGELMLREPLDGHHLYIVRHWLYRLIGKIDKRIYAENEKARSFDIPSHGIKAFMNKMTPEQKQALTDLLKKYGPPKGRR